jgi:hypothetical protein
MPPSIFDPYHVRPMDVRKISPGGSKETARVAEDTLSFTAGHHFAVDCIEGYGKLTQTEENTRTRYS